MDRDGALAARLRTSEQPISPSDGNAAERMLGDVFIDLQAPIIEDGNGIYLVFWFGRSVAGRPVPTASCGTRPGSAQELANLLKDSLAAGAEGPISVVVLDVERRGPVAPAGRPRLQAPKTG